MWTERSTGDYDENGEVNAGDLSPLAQHLQAAVQYDDASQHNDFAFWPTGDPEAAGATNWRLARMDGDGNGQINSSDITPIAKHWKEALQGYRVYRQAPNDTDFALLPNPADAGSAFTVTKPSPPQPGQLVPVRYSFTDNQATVANLGAGIYEFYVAPYDSGSQREGISSFAVSVDITTGQIKEVPIAKLAVTPDFAGAPVVVTLDASKSFDPDGSIASYRWDLDGDGVIDYNTSTDPSPPATSSDGSVVEITPVGAGRLTAKFVQPSASYLHPAVQVVDNESLASSPASVPLGISGWKKELVDSADGGSRKLPLFASDIGADPNTGQPVVYGGPSPFIPSMVPGLYYGGRADAGTWTSEIIADPTSAAWQSATSGYQIDGFAGTGCLAWDESNQPVLPIQADAGTAFFSNQPLITAHRQVGGSWSYDWPIAPHYPAGIKYYYQNVLDTVQFSPGHFVYLIADNYVAQTPADSVASSPLLFYDNGTWHGETTPDLFRAITLDSDGSILAVKTVPYAGPTDILIFRRTAPNTWEPVPFAPINMPFTPTHVTISEHGLYRVGQFLYVAAQVYSGETLASSSFVLLTNDANGFADLLVPYGQHAPENLYIGNSVLGGYLVGDLAPSTNGYLSFQYLYRENETTVEDIALKEAASSSGVYGFARQFGPHAAFGICFDNYTSKYDHEYLCTRLDPRQ
jgi:hypothetical protein